MTKLYKGDAAVQNITGHGNEMECSTYATGEYASNKKWKCVNWIATIAGYAIIIHSKNTKKIWVYYYLCTSIILGKMI